MSAGPDSKSNKVDPSAEDHAAHKHEHKHENAACCGSTCGDIAPTPPSPVKGRSFQVSGLDCVEEVSILSKVVGPKVGGAEHLAFDVINGRMTVLDSAEQITEARVVELVASTGMTARPWDAENANADQAAHLARQRWFTTLSGGFWAAGFGWHIVETGMGGAIGLRALYDGLPASAAVFTAPMWGIRMTRFLRAISGIVLGLSKPLGLDKTFAPTTGPAAPMVFDGNPLTHDRCQFDYMEGQVARHPELALGGPSITWVHAALEESGALLEKAPLDIPILTILGTEEEIVEPAAIHERMANWPNGQLETVQGARHEVLMEVPGLRTPCIDTIADWFDRHSGAASRTG